MAGIPQKLKKPILIALVSVLLLSGTALRLYRLGHHSLWLDECFTAVVSSRSLWNIVRFCVGDRGPLPLTYFFPWLAQSFTGNNTEFILRFFDLLFGSAGLFIFYLLARKLSSSDFIALASLFLLSFSSVHHYYSQEARGYTGFFFFCIIAFYFLWGAIEERKKLFWFNYFLSITGAFFFSFFATFLIATNFLFGLGLILMEKQSMPAKLRNLATLSSVLLLTLVPVGIWLLFALPSYQTATGVRFTLLKTFSFFADSFVKLTGGSSLFAGFLIFLLIVGLLLTKGKHRWFMLYPVLFFILAFATIYLSPTPPLLLHHRYVIGSLPFWLLSFVLSLDAIKVKTKRPDVRVLIPIAFLFCYFLVNMNTVWINFQREKQNWRAATSLVARNYQSGDVIFGGRNACHIALYHYLPAELQASLRRYPAPVGEMMKLMSQGKRIWYVTAYYRWYYPWLAFPAETPELQRFYDWLDYYFLKVGSFKGRDDIVVFLSQPLSSKSQSVPAKRPER